LEKLREYLGKFIEDRKLKNRSRAETIEQVFRQLEDVSIEQFEDNDKISSEEMQYLKSPIGKILNQIVFLSPPPLIEKFQWLYFCH
jgi:hypothetical protein